LIPVELAPEATASLRAMKDGGTPPPRCHKGVINSAIAGGVRRLIDGSLSGGVRPWDLQALQRRPTGLGEVSSARAVSVDDSVLVAELLPDGQRIVFRGVGGEWRLVRFADDGDVSIRPETTRRTARLRTGCGAGGAAHRQTRRRRAGGGFRRPGSGRDRDFLPLSVVRRRAIDTGRRVKNEIYDGATPYSTYVRGVIVDGDRGVLLTGRDDSALIIEG
jgi:hypothetical protein